jgi:hypothetical protein
MVLKNSSALDYVEKNGNNGNDKKNMNYTSGTERKKSDGPEKDKNDGNGIK